MEHIETFTGQYKFLSNFHPAEVEFDGIIYPTVEHAYQAAKTFNTTEREVIQHMETPGAAKRYGRGVELRSDWEWVKVDIMTLLCRRKFSQPDLREQLLATGDALLVEGNNHGDRFWGVYNGSGRNELGQILMEIRDECRKACIDPQINNP